MSNIIEKLAECVEFGKVDQNSPYPPHLKNQDGAYEWTDQAIKSGIKPQDILETALVPAMERVGKKFSENKIFVPQMLMSAKAMGAAMVLLKPFFAKGEIKNKGTYIIGTVQGDLHDIGKNLVSMMIEGSGWKVIDLGVDVASGKFIDSVKENPGAVIGLSALLTTTMVNMEEITKDIKKAAPGTLVTIGGAPVNDDFCEKIGADKYARDPQGIVEYLNKLAG